MCFLSDAYIFKTSGGGAIPQKYYAFRWIFPLSSTSFPQAKRADSGLQPIKLLHGGPKHGEEEASIAWRAKLRAVPPIHVSLRDRQEAVGRLVAAGAASRAGHGEPQRGDAARPGAAAGPQSPQDLPEASARSTHVPLERTSLPAGRHQS